MSSPEYSRMSRGRTGLLILAIAASLVCDVLGVWQINRLLARQERNRAALAEKDLGQVDLNQASLGDSTRFRRVRFEGRYDPEHEFLLRGRVLRGTPGVQVVTLARLAGRDTAVLVNRGFVPTPDAGAPPPLVRFEEAGPVAVQGTAVAVPDDGDGTPLETPNGETWHRLDLSAIRRRVPYPVAPYYVIAAPEARQIEHTLDGRSYPIRVEPPPLDDGPHLSYAIQWFLIGGAALGFGLVFVRRGRQHAPVPD